MQKFSVGKMEGRHCHDPVLNRLNWSSLKDRVLAVLMMVSAYSFLTLGIYGTWEGTRQCLLNNAARMRLCQVD